MTPARCPVCEGRGELPVGFYASESATSGPQTCRTCGGTGMVVTEQAASSGAPDVDDPRDLTYRG